MKFIRTIGYLLLAQLVIGAGVAGYILYFGVYNVSALQQHTGIVFEVLEYARVRAISTRSEQQVPDLSATDWRGRGAALYHRHCTHCHGGPGVAPDAYSLGMMPAPSPIVKIGRERTPEDIFWVIKHGVKMSGMPAWQYRLNEEDTWSVVALIKRLPTLTPNEYARLQARATDTIDVSALPAAEVTIDDNRLSLGRTALQQYNCTGCHRVPGVTAAITHVGPPLNNISEQKFLVGLLPMNPRTLKQWIRFPERIKPGTTMPNLNVAEQHAQLMVEYLYSAQVNQQ